MLKKWGRLFCMAILAFVLPAVAAKDAAAAEISGVRYSDGTTRLRIVYDVSSLPEYRLAYGANGRQVTLELAGITAANVPDMLNVQDAAVQEIFFSKKDSALQTVIVLRHNLEDGVQVEVNTLHNPERVYIDILKKFDQKFVEQIEDGLIYTKFLRNNEDGPLTAYFLEIDPKAGFAIKPMLAQDKIIGREALSAMTARNRAVAAVNSSYFSESGELLGFTKIDGEVASTTYIKRGALGINADETFFTGQVAYSGTVTANGRKLYLSGVNCERGENGLVVYNKFFGPSTGTNVYGREYAVKDGVVVAIYPNNAPLTSDVKVVSAHGASAAALADIRIGDPIRIQEDAGSVWDEARYAVGVGPLLVQDGRVHLTTGEEQFGSDVAYGRAPRTAVGVMANGHLLFGIVDGRQPHSIGCTLGEMASLMREFGAVEAVNFDGGGSTEMIVKNQIVNRPSDGRERRIGAALGVFVKK